MKGYTYHTPTYRTVTEYDVTDGEHLSEDEKQCEICETWVRADEIIEREEHQHCDSDKCKESVSMIILQENYDNGI